MVVWIVFSSIVCFCFFFCSFVVYVYCVSNVHTSQYAEHENNEDKLKEASLIILTLTFYREVQCYFEREIGDIFLSILVYVPQMCHLTRENEKKWTTSSSIIYDDFGRNRLLAGILINNA